MTRLDCIGNNEARLVVENKDNFPCTYF